MLSLRVLRPAAAVVILGLVACACTPELNWREVRPSRSEAKMLFPCKPTVETRDVVLGGHKLRMSLHACQAGGATYSLAIAAVQHPVSLSAAMATWKAAQASNLGAVPHQVVPSTPPSAARQGLPFDHHRMAGTMPDGSAANQEAIFIVRNLQIFHMAVTSSQVDREAAAIFFESLEWTPV